MDRMIDRWVDDAINAVDGSTRVASREQILKRLDPITDASTDARQVVFEGLRLELPNGARAEVIRGKLADLGLTAAEGRAPILENGGASLLPTIDVVHELSESHGGVAETRLCAPVVAEVGLSSSGGAGDVGVPISQESCTLGVQGLEESSTP